MILEGYLIEKYNSMSGGYTPLRLLEEAAKADIRLDIVGIYDSYSAKDGVHNLGRKNFADKPLEKRDFCINRYKWNNLKSDVAELCTRSYNPQAAFEKYINKYQQVKNLKLSAVKVPEYLLATAAFPFDAVASVLNVPFVAKGLESSMGQEIYLIENKEQYEELQKSFAPDKEFLFEEYISTSYGRDMRFYSIRGEAVACMQRSSVGDFRANVALGASVVEFPIIPEIRTTAKEVYEQTGLDFLGIDLLFGKDSPVFCEINVMPGLEGIEKASGINVAARIIDTVKGDFT